MLFKIYRFFYPLLARLEVEFYQLKAFLGTLMGFKKGVTQDKRSQPLVVSLTSYEARINKVYMIVDSLLRQSVKPDYLVLWLADDIKVPVPFMLKRLQKRGLQIKFCKDIRSYKKIIPTLKEFPGADIVTTDDDCFYPHKWLEQLYRSYQKRPAIVHCHRAHLIRLDETGHLRDYTTWQNDYKDNLEPLFRLFPTGVGGVLYPSGIFPNEVFNQEIFMKLCPKADDVWLKAMTLLNGKPCCKATTDKFKQILVSGSQATSLYLENVGKGGNDVQLQAVINHYGLLPFIRDHQ